ncbi:MAG: U32 family peptidase, partial [Firmicutes bacterium]|nr:U32 family peptidase [Bacillota bacterium]
TGAVLPVMTHCQSCTAFILNSAPIFLAHRFKEIKAVNAEYLRLDLTVETAEQTKNILDMYTKAFAGGEISVPDMPHTGGHYFRGVQ